MGILNVTPDSFSDGGQFADAATAVGAGVRMAERGRGDPRRRRRIHPARARRRSGHRDEIERVAPGHRTPRGGGAAVSIDTRKSRGDDGGAQARARAWSTTSPP